MVICSVIYSMFLQHNRLEKPSLLTCLANEIPSASLCAVNVRFLNQAALEQLGHQNRKVLTRESGVCELLMLSVSMR